MKKKTKRSRSENQKLNFVFAASSVREPADSSKNRHTFELFKTMDHSKCCGEEPRHEEKGQWRYHNAMSSEPSRKRHGQSMEHKI